MPRLAWDKERILKTLRQQHRAGKEMSYNALARTMQSLLSAAAYHFGSYRKAVEAAGIEYADVTRRPRWTRQRIVALIKSAHKEGEDLHWAAVTKRRDELGKAAFASLQPRLFGRWDKALQAAGLDAGEISQYRKWDKEAVSAELRSRAKTGSALNSGAIQKEDPGLHAAAVRHFGTYDMALRSAKIDPSRVRRRQRWDKEAVLKRLRELDQGPQGSQQGSQGTKASSPSIPSPAGGAKKAGGKSGKSEKSGKAKASSKGKPAPGVKIAESSATTDSGEMSDAAIRRNHAALYSAAVRLFGSVANARAAATKKK